MNSFSEHTRILREHAKEEQLDEVFGFAGRQAWRTIKFLGKTLKNKDQGDLLTDVMRSTLGAAVIGVTLTAGAVTMRIVGSAGDFVVAVAETGEEIADMNPIALGAFLLAAGVAGTVMPKIINDYFQTKNTVRLARAINGEVRSSGEQVNNPVITITPEITAEAQKLLEE